ncbi:MAG: hypothetical protein IKP31_06820 [Lachnospiraceae bacterium]|nr:hypothetical protein [Lachnospiraceae bacterium]
MNDSYVECMVARKSSPFLGILKYIIYILTGVSIIGVVAGYYIFLVTLIIFGLLAYFAVPGFELEFEYLYLDREISIDKIMSKQKRKRIRTLELGKMEYLCPINSHQLDQYKARNLKLSDYSSKDPDSKIWVMVYKDQNTEELIGFEPNDEMLKAVKNIYPRKVIEY